MTQIRRLYDTLVDPPTEIEQKLFALLPKFPAFITCLSSVCVIVSLLRSAQKRKKMYHRIAFAMACYGIVQAFNMSAGTSAFPPGTSYTYGAAGTVTSCTVQGMLTQMTLAIPYYYSSLSVYCFLAIRADFKEERIVWIEPWIHGIIHMLTLPSTIFLAATESLNPLGPVCWIAAFPEICLIDANEPCIRGDASKIRFYAMIFAAIPAYLSIVLAIVMMVMIYRTQLRKESLKELQGKKKIFEKARKKKSRIIAIQATLYLMAFFIAYAVAISTRTIMLFTGHTIYVMWIIGCCLMALQSFFFITVYFGLQLRNKPIHEYPLNASYCSMLREKISESKDLACRGEAKTNDEKETHIRRRSFSIFDGSKVSSSHWGAFLIDDDDESDNSNDYDCDGNFDMESAFPVDKEKESNMHNSAEVVQNDLIQESECEES